MKRTVVIALFDESACQMNRVDVEIVGRSRIALGGTVGDLFHAMSRGKLAA